MMRQLHEGSQHMVSVKKEKVYLNYHQRPPHMVILGIISVVTPHLNWLDETVQMRGHNIRIK